MSDDEMKSIEDWDQKDGQACTQLELSIRDSEMVHLLLATTARKMWEVLEAVKEPEGHWEYLP